MSPGSHGPQNQQIGVADATRPPQHTAEVTRRDGLSSLKSNILSAVGMLSGSWGGNYVVENFWKSRFFDELHLIKIAGCIFQTPTEVIPWCMQNLSSIHRLGEKLERAQGFGPWHRKLKSLNVAEK